MIIVSIQGAGGRSLDTPAGVERVRETCSRNADTSRQALDHNQAVVEGGHFGAEQEFLLGTAAGSRTARTGTRLPVLQSQPFRPILQRLKATGPALSNVVCFPNQSRLDRSHIRQTLSSSAMRFWDSFNGAE
jgi:hypothetical protein